MSIKFLEERKNWGRLINILKDTYQMRYYHNWYKNKAKTGELMRPFIILNSNSSNYSSGMLI
jgi:hypothetical protein